MDFMGRGCLREPDGGRHYKQTQSLLLCRILLNKPPNSETCGFDLGAYLIKKTAIAVL